eukprot:707630-Rhodomonas_salina.1
MRLYYVFGGDSTRALETAETRPASGEWWGFVGTAVFLWGRKLLYNSAVCIPGYPGTRGDVGPLPGREMRVEIRADKPHPLAARSHRPAGAQAPSKKASTASHTAWRRSPRAGPCALLGYERAGKGRGDAGVMGPPTMLLAIPWLGRGTAELSRLARLVVHPQDCDYSRPVPVLSAAVVNA